MRLNFLETLFSTKIPYSFKTRLVVSYDPGSGSVGGGPSGSGGPSGGPGAGAEGLGPGGYGPDPGTPDDGGGYGPNQGGYRGLGIGNPNSYGGYGDVHAADLGEPGPTPGLGPDSESWGTKVANFTENVVKRTLKAVVHLAVNAVESIPAVKATEAALSVVFGYKPHLQDAINKGIKKGFTKEQAVTQAVTDATNKAVKANPSIVSHFTSPGRVGNKDPFDAFDNIIKNTIVQKGTDPTTGKSFTPTQKTAATTTVKAIKSSTSSGYKSIDVPSYDAGNPVSLYTTGDPVSPYAAGNPISSYTAGDPVSSYTAGKPVPLDQQSIHGQLAADLGLSTDFLASVMQPIKVKIGDQTLSLVPRGQRDVLRSFLNYQDQQEKNIINQQHLNNQDTLDVAKLNAMIGSGNADRSLNIAKLNALIGSNNASQKLDTAKLNAMISSGNADRSLNIAKLNAMIGSNNASQNLNAAKLNALIGSGNTDRNLNIAKLNALVGSGNADRDLNAAKLNAMVSSDNANLALKKNLANPSTIDKLEQILGVGKDVASVAKLGNEVLGDFFKSSDSNQNLLDSIFSSGPDFNDSSTYDFGFNDSPSYDFSSIGNDSGFDYKSLGTTSDTDLLGKVSDFSFGGDNGLF